MSQNIPYVADYYETLGVTRDATPDQIKKAFRKLARSCHPDVAGDDPEAARRFDRVRRAYETLSDPESRKAYDNRGKRRRRRRWTEDGYRMPGGFYVQRDGTGSMGGSAPPRPGRNPTRTPRSRAHPSNGMDLNDIFGDFGFGAETNRPKAQGGASRDSGGGSGRRGSTGSGGSGPPPDNRQTYGHRDEQGDRTGSPGSDISMSVDVPARTAARGGVVTLEYPRLRLTEDGRSVGRYDEIHDLRLPPGARSGMSVRVPRMGNAGTDGSVGDLVCDLRVVADAETAARPSVDARQSGPEGFSSAGSAPYLSPGAPRSARSRSRARQPSPSPSPRPVAEPPAPAPAPTAEGDDLVLDISIVDALLGGRIPVETPSGTVRLTVPPGTSGGTRFRLRGRGLRGVDLYARARIVVPKTLDAESRSLIERFASLNPDA